MSKTKAESFKNWLSRTVEKELEDDIARDDIVASIPLIVVSVLMLLYFGAHQLGSTGFFTAEFGTLEMLLLYGISIFWIATSTLMLLGAKNASRNLDTYGGLMFATIATVWLVVVFPFDFEYFADASPDYLRFLVQWISNGIARVLGLLGFIAHLAFTVISVIIRMAVRKAQREKN